MKRTFFLLCVVWSAALAQGRADDLTVDMDKATTLDTNAPPVNLAAEVARAKSENKLLLLEFGSSDSCPPCVLFQKRVFSQTEFKAYEKSNLDFIRLDFPFRASLRADTMATNNLLARQFEADGFPTFIALDKDGKEFWRMPKIADLKSGNFALDTTLFEPTNFIALIESLKKQKK
jgi:thioredoxin-related protein